MNRSIRSASLRRAAGAIEAPAGNDPANASHSPRIASMLVRMKAERRMGRSPAGSQAHSLTKLRRRRLLPPEGHQVEIKISLSSRAPPCICANRRRRAQYVTYRRKNNVVRKRSTESIAGGSSRRGLICGGCSKIRIASAWSSQLRTPRFCWRIQPVDAIGVRLNDPRATVWCVESTVSRSRGSACTPRETARGAPAPRNRARTQRRPPTRSLHTRAPLRYRTEGPDR